MSVGRGIQDRVRGRVVQPAEEGHPEHLLEGLGAVRGDDDAIGVRPLRRRRALVRQAREESVPQHRREHEGIVAVAMAAELRKTGQGSEERRVGKEGVRTGKSRVSPSPYKKNTKNTLTA